MRRYRTLRRFSQEQLAARIGVTKGTVHNWESGATRLNTDDLVRLMAVESEAERVLLEGLRGDVAASRAIAVSHAATNPDGGLTRAPEPRRLQRAQVVRSTTPKGDTTVDEQRLRPKLKFPRGRRSDEAL